MVSGARHNTLYIFFTLVLFLHVIAWLQLRTAKAEWLNVPPVPSERGASALALGDRQFSYRIIGIMLQNLGDTGGRYRSFKDYDYDSLTGWFYLADKLDPHSNFVPMLAAYYFSAADDQRKLSEIAEYLHEIGMRNEGQKWRWLAQAVYLQRYKLNDLDKAYKWAQEMAALDNPDMPPWTRQMPAFILNAEGDKQAAYDIMVEMLKTGKNKLPREEINAMTDYICDQILDEEKAAADPICQSRQ